MNPATPVMAIFTRDYTCLACAAAGREPPLRAQECGHGGGRGVVAARVPVPVVEEVRLADEAAGRGAESGREVEHGKASGGADLLHPARDEAAVPDALVQPVAQLR